MGVLQQEKLPAGSPSRSVPGARLPFHIYWDMISGMTGMDETNESQASTLCKSCGLCCTGHLFIRTKLRSGEMDSAQALGLNVLRSDPRLRGFSQPCPLWHGQCTIHDSPRYPRFCGTYQCKLLKEMLEENTSLPHALTVIEQAKGMIHELEVLLPRSQTLNFRERLVTHLEKLEETARQDKADLEFRQKAVALLAFYKKVFGVDDLVDLPEEE
ncbi:MAG TPA: hypothetical protein VLE49_15185 [Anaerolineales bacterium]|nr:hypothetical protein [Anaerolineales bacterium]